MDKKAISEAKKKVGGFFAGELEKFGPTHEATNWGSKKSQYARFDVISGVGDMRGRSVLDVGCGLGAFYEYLRSRRINADYTGADLCEEMVAGAKKLFARSKSAKFVAADILEMSSRTRFDFVIASGTFNINLKNNEKLIREVIAKMYQMSRAGVAVSMLSVYADFTEKFYYYYDPAEIFEFCKSICKNVALRHDYMPHDFTIFLRKG